MENLTKIQRRLSPYAAQVWTNLQVIMGSLRFMAQASNDLIFARSLFEGPVRAAIEQIKMFVYFNTRVQSYEEKSEPPSDSECIFTIEAKKAKKLITVLSIA